MPDGSQPSRSTGATARLAAFAVSARVGTETLARATTALLDTLAVTAAGGAEPAVRRLASTLPPAVDGVPTLWSGPALREDDAALLHGMSSHALDYDDVSMLTVCHPSAPVASALLPLAWASGRGGRDLLEALAIGTEVSIRLGQAMGFRHYELGFHATGTLGVVGAAAACARLVRLDEARTAHALAIAASHSAGLRANFGTNVKSLHVGIAAAHGLRAARGAQAGIEGSREVLEGTGFLHAFSGGQTHAWPTDLMLGEPFALDEPGFEQKRYPCCYLLHKMIEGTLALRAEHGVGLDDVATARVDVPQGGTSALIHPFPRTGLNALFSGPYAVAAALADGRIDLASFTDAAVTRPALQARLGDVTLVEDAAPALHGSDVGSAPVTVTLLGRDGRSYRRTVIASPGSPADPLTEEQAGRKWVDCLRRAAPNLDAARAEQLLAGGRQIGRLAEMRPWLMEMRGLLVS